MKKIVELKEITKEFDGERVLDNLSLDIYDKQFITLLGPSGCGKTTTLRIIGGFEEPDNGEVFFEGKKINHVPPYKRHINTVFQKYALFPHLNVYENIAFALRLQKLSNKEISKKVKEMLELVALKGFEKKNVTFLSGGQQQRVAIARAAVKKPRILFADEPTASLDHHTAQEIMKIFSELQENTTIVCATHDYGILPQTARILRIEDGKVVEDRTGGNK